MRKVASLCLVVVIAVLFFMVMPSTVEAGAFTQAYVRINRMKTNTTTGGTVCAKTANAGTESSVTITFPGNGTQGASSFGVNSTPGNWTVTTTNLPSGATGWVGITTASGDSGASVTIGSGELAQNTLYCFNFSGTSTLTTPTNSGGSLTGTIATNLDSSQWATAVIANDQILVTATVSPIFTFAISDTSNLYLGVLSTSTVSTSTGRTITIATNAASGWIAWVMSQNGALSSVTTGTSIASPGTNNDTPDSLAGQAGYVLGVAITTNGGGSGTVTQAAGYGAEFADSSNTGGHLTAGTYDAIAASNGTSDGSVLTFYAKAKVSALQAPGTDYTDTLTFVGAGRF